MNAEEKAKILYLRGQSPPALEMLVRGNKISMFVMAQCCPPEIVACRSNGIPVDELGGLEIDSLSLTF